MLMSAGILLRQNLFGAMIVGPFYAFSEGGDSAPFFRGFGINFAQGW